MPPHGLTIITAKRVHGSLALHPFAGMPGAWLKGRDPIDEASATKVGNEGPQEFVHLFPPNFRSKGLPHRPSVRRNLALPRVSLHPPVIRLEFEVQAEMKAGKRVNVDDPSVTSLHGGEIERVGFPHLGLDPLEIFSRVDSNKCESPPWPPPGRVRHPANLQSREC